MRFVSSSASCWVAVLLIVGGCTPTRQPIKTVKVSGNVKMAGKPLSEVEVNFLGKDYAGISTTDAAGNYTCNAQPGENTIYFAKYAPDYDPTMSVGDSGQGGPKNAIPAKYGSAEASKLTHTVPDEDVTGVDFDLK
jgi:hypothetical protein